MAMVASHVDMVVYVAMLMTMRVAVLVRMDHFAMPMLVRVHVGMWMRVPVLVRMAVRL